MGDYRKVFRFRFYVVCQECGHTFDLDLKYLTEMDIARGHIPLKANSSNGTVLCPKCGRDNPRLNYEYKNVYRRRCLDCREMFDAEEPWRTRCLDCDRRRADERASMAR